MLVQLFQKVTGEKRFLCVTQYIFLIIFVIWTPSVEFLLAAYKVDSSSWDKQKTRQKFHAHGLMLVVVLGC